MNGYLLVIPFLLIRFTLLSAYNKKALSRAAHFAPMQGREIIAYTLYQITNAGIFLVLIFLPLHIDFSCLFYSGLILYLTGLILCARTMKNFAAPNTQGLNNNGVYKYSRNPMYVAYFICFLGMALLVQSWTVLGLVLLFQVSAHWVILAEERECIKNFGAAYVQYMQSARRYL